MAAFVYAPEIPIAEILSQTLGLAAGAISSAAIAAINNLQKRIDEACEKISQGDMSGYDDLEKIDAEVDAIEKTLDVLEASLTVISDILAVIKIAITVAKIALLAATAATAVPMVPPALAIACQIVGELVAQISQLVSALQAVIDTILSIIQPIREMLKNLRRLIKSLYVSEAIQEAISEGTATEKDIQDLKDTGILDDHGQDIFGKVVSSLVTKVADQAIFSCGGTGFDSSGESFSIQAGDSGLDLTDTETLNRILAVGDQDTELDISKNNCGDWIADAYLKADNKPATPTSPSVPPTGGWTLTEPKGDDLEKWWWSWSVVSGTTGQAIAWSEPVGYVNKPVKDDSTFDTDPKGLSGTDTGIVKLGVVHLTEDMDISRYSSSPVQYAVVTDPDVAYGFIVSMLDRLSLAAIGDDLKNQLRSLLDTVESPTQEDYETESDLYYRDAEGNLYTLNVVVDPDSPSISPLRYVEVVDESGTVVYTGTKTFATDTAVILEETRVRLAQLLS